jgi:phytoene/squalene synthetase
VSDDSALAACAALVEGADPDRFAATMAAPVAARSRLWPLYAVNVEVARAAYASDEPLVAEMRLQWWADQIGRLMEGAEGQGEVAHALGIVLRTVPDVATPFLALIEARRWDCWREPFASDEALAAYLDATAGGLAWAAALALGAPTLSESAVRAFAFGMGLANWFDAVPALLARGRSPLPDRSGAAIRALAERGLARIRSARDRRADVPRVAVPALWPGWSAERRLRAAARAPSLVLEGCLPEARALRAPALMFRALTGRW